MFLKDTPDSLAGDLTAAELFNSLLNSGAKAPKGITFHSNVSAFVSFMSIDKVHTHKTHIHVYIRTYIQISKHDYSHHKPVRAFSMYDIPYCSHIIAIDRRILRYNYTVFRSIWSFNPYSPLHFIIFLLLNSFIYLTTWTSI